MADPLSIAASIARIISLADAVFRYTFKFSRTASGATDEVHRLNEEINSFSTVMRKLHALACDLEAQGQVFESALRVEHLAQCERTFEKIRKRVTKAVDDFNNPSKWQGLARQLKWPYSVSETKDLLADISRYKDTISLAASADTMRQLQLLLPKQAKYHDETDKVQRNTLEKVEIGTRILLDNQKRTILDFFMSPDSNPQSNLDQSIKWRQPTTGLPGGGTTVLAGAVIQEALSKASAATSSIGVAFYFCDYKNNKTHSPVQVLGAIANQLALQKDESFEVFEKYYQDLHPTRSLSQSPDVDELRASITRMAETFDKTFIIIDGVDECGDKVEEVAIALSELADSADSASIAIFSRDEEEIRIALGMNDFGHIDIAARTEDIVTYIRADMMSRESRGQFIVRDTTVKERIENELVKRADGIFAHTSYLVKQGIKSDKPCVLGKPFELSQTAFIGILEWSKSKFGHEAEFVNTMSFPFLFMLPSPERRNKTFICLSGDMTPSNTNRHLVFHSMIVSWAMHDFTSTIELLAHCLSPSEFEAKQFGIILNESPKSTRSSFKLGLAIEKFNDYLLQSSALNTDWGLSLGQIIWSTAVAMGLSFTKDPTRTISKISLSEEALKDLVLFAIVDENTELLSKYLGDGQIGVSETGCSDRDPKETLLHIAIRNNALNCVDLLLEKGSNACARNSPGCDAVLQCSLQKAVNILHVLVRHDVSLLSVHKGSGWTIWHREALDQDWKPDWRHAVFNANIQETQKGLQMKDSSGAQPLTIALKRLGFGCSHDAEASLLYFISRCSEVPSFWENQDPVFEAAFESRSIRVVQMLFDLGLDPETSGLARVSPLHDLASYDSLHWAEFVKSLSPHALTSRRFGRFPFGAYIKKCIENCAIPNPTILDELIFDGLFECQEGQINAWADLCACDYLFGAFYFFDNKFKAFQQSLLYSVKHGCIEAYESSTGQCGLEPYFGLLGRVADSRVLATDVKALDMMARSTYWDPKSKLAMDFMKTILLTLDLDTVKLLLENGVPASVPMGGESVVQNLNRIGSFKSSELLQEVLQASKKQDIKIEWDAPFSFQFTWQDTEWNERMSAFQLSIYNGYDECVRFFLRTRLANIWSKTDTGLTALHLAAMRGNEKVVSSLIEYGFNITALDTSSAPPSIKLKKVKPVSLLTQLGVAIKNSDLSLCQALRLSDCPLEIPIPGTKGLSPLALSFQRGELKIAKWLLDQGVSVLYFHIEPYNMRAPIIIAAGLDRLAPLLPTLMDRFTQQNGNWDYCAPKLLRAAIDSGNEKGIEIHLSYLDKHFSDRSTLCQVLARPLPYWGPSCRKGTFQLLHQVASGGNIMMAKVLLENGAVSDAVDSFGNTCMSLATTPEMVEMLLKFGGSPTPLLVENLSVYLASAGKRMSRAAESLVRTVEDQTGCPSSKWLDTSLPVFSDGHKASRRSCKTIAQLTTLDSNTEVPGGVVSFLLSSPNGRALRDLLGSNTMLRKLEPFAW
ncbi:ankyrin repeat [Fusarium mundagurra]|uniref:Ankyrin repeat n=1 Tax=Fusarium mundagurra TaxID=1567541 RepID=A0A8H5YPY0_9HYPO|nr:ankyrin repeat [Fusarium mundagurra]